MARTLGATISPAGYRLYDALIAEGYQLPDECGEIRVIMPPDGIVILQCDIHVSGENLAKIGRALARVGEHD